LPNTSDCYTAAGGVVVHRQRVLVLLWSSRNEVRLPKGHVEPGETVRYAALREAREETGYLSLDIVADLGSQRVIFEDGDRHVDRTERYFLMALGGEQGNPMGSSEAKFDSVWMTWDEAMDSLTYEAEREWIVRARAGATRGEGAGASPSE